MEIILFSEILEKAMFENGIASHQRLLKILMKNSIDKVTHQRISDFLNNKRLPSPELAQQILSALDKDYDLDYLRQVVEYSKEEIKKPEYNYKDPVYKERRNVTINFSELVPGQLGFQAKQTLDDRIEELCGSKSEFSLYINNLIKNDLIKVALGKEQMTNE